MLVAFLRDDLHILLSVFVGAYLVVSQVEKRPRLALRLAVCLAVISAWMMLNSFQPAVLFAGFSMFARGSIKYSGLFILNVLAVLFYSRAGFFTALFAATVGYSIQHTCERLWEILRRLELMPVWLDRICLSLVLAAALYLYNRLVLRRSHSDRFTSFDRLDSRILLFIASAVIMGNIVIDLRLISNFQNMTQEGQALFDLTTAMISGLVLVVSMCHLREAESQRRAEIADQLLHSEQARYAQDKAIHEAINIKCHDIRHQIAALGEEGRQKQLREIGSLVNIYDSTFHSANTALDVVLSNKSLACRQKGVSMSCLVDGKQLDFMADEDVYSLFGNILDNAIDAAEAIGDPERRLISLTVRSRDDFVLIEEENFYDGDLRYDDGLPVTTKGDTAYHGFGMQSIRLLTDRYGGDLNLESSGGIFRLSILIPVPGNS